MMAHVRILHSNKQEQMIDSLNNLADSQMLHAEWKKPVSKSLQTTSDSITQHSGGVSLGDSRSVTARASR